jgi:hypothetical protein
MLLVSPAGLGLVGGTVRSSQDAKSGRYQIGWLLISSPILLEVRARLKITITVQRPDLARTFL